MAQVSTRRVSALDQGCVLAPERYDPRRMVESASGVRLADIAEVPRDQVTPAKAGDRAYLVLDTSDAREGAIVAYKNPCLGSALGSTKKRLQAGDVIISRLRPYLRQVALVDAALAARVDADLVCSTEFYVLRSRDEASLAFLVPFLLGTSAQATLAAAQEGGHHPRFSQSTLESLVIPHHVLAERDRLSAQVEAAVHATRQGQSGMLAAIELTERYSRDVEHQRAA